MEGRGGWHAGDTLNFSIGQGEVQVTPLQLIRLMTLVARNGWIVQPHVIKAIGGTAVDKFTDERKVKIDEEVLETVRKGLRGAVVDAEGTARVIGDLPDLYVAGKTGTAQTSGGKRTMPGSQGTPKGKSAISRFAFCLSMGARATMPVCSPRICLCA